MLILYEISVCIGDFHVPDVNAVGVQPKSGNVIHITVDGIFWLYAKRLHCTISMGKRQRIVHAIECHLLAARSIAHHSLLIHIHARSPFSRHARRTIGIQSPMHSKSAEKRAGKSCHKKYRFQFHVDRFMKWCKFSITKLPPFSLHRKHKSDRLGKNPDNQPHTPSSPHFSQPQGHESTPNFFVYNTAADISLPIALIPSRILCTVDADAFTTPNLNRSRRVQCIPIRSAKARQSKYGNFDNK